MTKTPDGIEIIARPETGRRRRSSAEENGSWLRRRCGIDSSSLFRWRRLMEHGELESLDADEEVVASEVKQLRARVRELER
jgi:transposase-like protein